jgi:hypothetical protein
MQRIVQQFYRPRSSHSLPTGKALRENSGSAYANSSVSQ